MYHDGKLQLSEEEKELADSSVGEFGIYEGKKVPLDVPLMV